MNGTQNPPVRPGTLAPAAGLLRRAARGLRNGEITWGRDEFVGDDGCRCLAAAITWAAEPGHPDGDPRFVYGPRRQAVQMAVAAVAEHITCELGWPWSITDGELDLIETLGSWNDAQDGPAPVIDLLEAVAEVIRPAALGGAA